MALTMVPPADHLPDVLPTPRLSASGMPVPEVRAELRTTYDRFDAAYRQVLRAWFGQNR